MSSTRMSQAGFYVLGGTLRRDAECYVARKADTDLYEGLKQGKFCYVLTSRQMGKSSLMVRTAARLREEGVAVAVIDLTAIGQNLTAEQWYDGLLGRIGQQLNLEDELEDFWLEHERLSPLQRLMRAIREVVMEHKKERIIISIDEIDAVRSLPFSTDEFFAAIREFYNRRTEDQELNRLTFCLLGVATPSDLIRDTRTTPFNIGQRIELNDFSEPEAARLAQGLGRKEGLALALLKRIIYWTGGHPYLTQRLCQAIAEDSGVANSSGVDRICESLFLSTRAREQDDNLLFVRERMLKSEVDIAGLLDLYAQVRASKRVPDDETNILISVLRLSGITRVIEGYLSVRNRIYFRVFDKNWVIANMPDAELRRQRAAFRRGLVRAAAVATLILAVMAVLALTAIRQAEIATQERNRAEQEAIHAESSRSEAISSAETARSALERMKTALAKAEEQETIANSERKKALELKKIADFQKQKAVAQTGIADKERNKAEEQRQQAENQRQEALKLIAELDRLRQEEAKNKKSLEDQGKRSEQYELNLWEMIKDQKNSSLLKKFLEMFPNGRFTRQAQDQIALAARETAIQAGSNGSTMTGTIEGGVYDTSFKPIAGAKVTVTNESSGNARSTITDATGYYKIPFLPPGSYSISIQKEGYVGELIEAFPVSLNMVNVVRPPAGVLRERR